MAQTDDSSQAKRWIFAGRKTLRAVSRDTPPGDGDYRALVQSLQLHQLELEAQNQELIRAHQELERSRADYQDLYDGAPVGYLTLSEHSLILELNHTAEVLAGVERGSLLAQPFSRLVHSEDQPVFYQKRRILFEQGAVPAFELRLLHRTGGVVWVNVLASLARDRSGDPVWRITLGDITARRRAEAALVQAQKFESMGLLAGGMAHDFNNLLAAMLGSLELLALMETPEERGRQFATLQACILRASGLCQQMLTYAGRTTFNRSSIRLDDLVRSCLGIMKVALPTGVDLRLELDPDPPEIDGDAAQIQQALMSLVINAAEAMEQGGNIHLRCRARTLEAEDLAGQAPGAPLEPGPCVVLEVEDPGAGMDAGALKKIFEPFYTTRFIGRGLGLAAVLGIMRMNGGAVQVRSRTGQGSCFSLWFPRAGVPEAQALRPVSPAVLP